MMSTEQGVSAFPEGENLFKWIGTITGPRDTVRNPLQRNSLDFNYFNTRTAENLTFLKQQVISHKKCIKHFQI